MESSAAEPQGLGAAASKGTVAGDGAGELESKFKINGQAFEFELKSERLFRRIWRPGELLG